jgi:hypothetical protein
MKLNVLNIKGKVLTHFSRKVTMAPSSTFYRCLYILFFLLSFNVSAEYLEGIDTTDVNGYGLDSTFMITNDSIRGINAIGFAPFGIKSDSTYLPYIISGTALFNYTFDDIKIAPLDLTYYSFQTLPFWFRCFVIKHKDSTYSKIQIVTKLSDNRYTFKYGTNTIANDRLLAEADYDRSHRYKPNNAYNHHRYPSTNWITWEPPLPNNNHLIGYILYRSKNGAIIDTLSPIDSTQWDSLGFIDTTKCTYSSPYAINGRYLNLVAVYTEGKSNFINGWTYYFLENGEVGITNSLLNSKKISNKMEIKKIKGGFSIIISQSLSSKKYPVFLYMENIHGQKVERLSSTTGNYFFLNMIDLNIPTGLYLLRAEFPDRSVITQPFTVTR